MSADARARIDGSLKELRRSLAGTVLTPEEAEYDAARRCFNAFVDRRPAVIAAFGAETFDRLRALKRRYDPNNVLGRNQNVPPADSSGA